MPPPRTSDTPATAPESHLKVTPEIAAEAAVWVARLHGPSRSRTMELACLDWQGRSAAHRLAFERCTDTWEAVSGLTLSVYAGATAGARPHHGANGGFRIRRAVLVSTALGGAASLAWRLLPDEQIYETGVGERRVVMLADGTRMSLNTSTDVRVELTKTRRAVSVRSGEVLFEVAKDSSRAFEVQVANAKVVATGTAFLVRATPRERDSSESFGVTLIEGRVVVQRPRGAQTMPASLVMAPGDRMRVLRSEEGRAGEEFPPPRLDRPRLNQLLAWQRGEAVFDNTPLPEAVAELNRYSKAQIFLVGVDGEALRVSGVYRTGDNDAFARAVARLHDLVLQREAGGVTLTAP
ncbi:FecR family protein [Roseateles chitinivorans]|uniref:FecR family protein n=1 Tax=Roseateles chitinivorans TaxID=2917965 RepID=UPI003D671703